MTILLYDEAIYGFTQWRAGDTEGRLGKGGEKNYAGVITNLQMQTYLVILEFARRRF